jgi:DNA mismatch endonuclease (patch repair protein)
MDIVSPKKRSAMMSGIRATNTLPEMVVRSLLFNEGFRYRLHRRDLAGKPDIVLPKYHAVIFVHGCFWHLHQNCRLSKIPNSNVEFWRSKLTSNHERDQRNITRLRDAGWRVLTVWECATRNLTERQSLADELTCWVLGDQLLRQIPDLNRNE